MVQLIKGAFPYFVVPFILSLVLVPICKRFGFKLKIYAMENSRTVHHGRMVRMGGLAIYLAFMIAMAIFVDADYTWNGIVIGASIVFFCGLVDDCLDIKPTTKLIFQSAGALVAIIVGKISLEVISLPFGVVIDTTLISFFISFIWIVGVTNSINLLDGLDGLSSGVCFIVLCTIGLIGYFQGRRDVCVVTLILAGATLGFLPYNFHPASIFMGDCGALFLGFVIACVSLLGFKTTAFITLGFPIMILFVPISDTLIAIVRRKLSGKRFSDADRSHLHHILMYKLHLGHRNTVLILYIVTAVFSACAILNYFDSEIGLLVLLILLLLAELFVEKTEMINPKFHPLISLCRKLTGWPKESRVSAEIENKRKEARPQ